MASDVSDTPNNGSGPFEPFEDFAEAARAVFGKAASLEATPTSELLGRLLSTLLAAETHTATESRRAERAESESLLDHLTGLANRRAWERQLEAEEDRCRRHGIDVSVVVIDLNDLKAVNDAHGHTAGDELLRSAARALVSQTRAHDTVARLGGDEFGLLLPHCPGPEAEFLTIRLNEALRAEGIVASLGFATRDPAHGLRHAWQEADRAMYESKRRGDRPDGSLRTRETRSEPMSRPEP